MSLPRFQSRGVWRSARVLTSRRGPVPHGYRAPRAVGASPTGNEAPLYLGPPDHSRAPQRNRSGVRTFVRRRACAYGNVGASHDN